MAVYHYLQGTGFTTVEGTRYSYRKGDTIVCPPRACHEHEATGDEDTIMYVCQDMTEVAAKRTLLFEKPVGVAESPPHGAGHQQVVERNPGSGQGIEREHAPKEAGMEFVGIESVVFGTSDLRGGREVLRRLGSEDGQERALGEDLRD